MSRLSRTPRALLVFVGLWGAACAHQMERVELTTQGPTAEDLLNSRSYAINGRAPSFDEKRQWQGQMEDNVYGYLRQHPELEQTTRYTVFRFSWQVTKGSTPEEVRLLLDEPQEKTVDPARMAALAEQHWPDLDSKAKEAWVYEKAWVVYFDDDAVIAMVHRVPAGSTKQ
jgi:hypothetical protein